MVYGIENHGLSPYQPSSSCIRRDNLNVGITCENFNSTNLIHSQISTTTQNTRKRNSTFTGPDGCNIDLSGLSREERRSNLKIVALPRPGHFHCFPLFSVEDSRKNWKCPGLERYT